MALDPVTAGILTSAAGELIASGVSRALRLAHNHTAATVEAPEFFVEVKSDDEGGALLSAAQVAAVEAVLGDPRVAPLIEASCLARTVFDTRSSVESALADIERTFLQTTAAVFEEAGIPQSTAELVWREMEAQIDRILGTDLREMLTSEERNQLLGAERQLRVERDKDAEVPAWLAELLALATNRERLIEVKIRAASIRRNALIKFGNLELRHSPDTTEGRPLESLYIHRTLQSDEGKHYSSDTIFGTGTRGRIVVTGPPGNGKSTLTQHVIVSVSEGSDIYVPLLLRVRESNLDTILLTHELTDSVKRLYQDPHIRLQHVEDMLTLGRAVVIFDGLDEILDKGKRQSFVAKIEAFAHQYPLCTVVATSRDNGYSDAPFSRVFTKYKLLPFTMGQVEEYAEKWFSADPSNPDHGPDQSLVNSFLRDLQPVEEIAQNPLMLSLLCILYRNRGYIPRNRRAVYKDCADLLFRRWDSMRDIEQPTDHVEHGEDLMEEIALFYFKSQAAQSGVQERQLTKIIASYLEDSAGVLPAQAKFRAKKFLDFCAGRAWLLGVDGTHAGERVFTFTHRTFMEYFAAEGMVRTNNDAASLAEVIIREYEKNSASVLPDLIVLAAEAGARGRVRELLTEIKQRERLIAGKGEGRLLPLRMRIASVLNLQPKHFDLLMEEAFEVLDGRWNALTAEVAEALFRLPRNPRARVEAYAINPAELGSDADESVCRARQERLLLAWIDHELTTGESLRAHEWENVIERTWERYLASGPTSNRWIRYYQLFNRGDVVDLQPEDLEWVLPRGTEQRRYGAYAMGGMLALLGRANDRFDEIFVRFNMRRRPPGLSYDDAYFVAGGIVDAVESTAASETWPVAELHRPLVIALAMIWWEIHGRYDEMAELLGDAIGLPLAAIVGDRELPEKLSAISQPAPPVSPETRTETRQQLGEICGTWATKWMDDKFNWIFRERE